MEIPTRNTRKYTFQEPDVAKLRELGRKVASQDDFRELHGKLLDILKVDVTKGVLETLVQLYDRHCHCFTFPDYQIVPTLEEYSHLIGITVLNKVPFSGLEPNPKATTIAKVLHLEVADIKDEFTLKNGLQCLSYNFLHQKAAICFEKSKTNAFESILALLIYGIILFPNVDNFVDMNVIRIFLTQNPVPVLLTDTYISIHERTRKEKGTIICCTPLLHCWITSHLPRPKFQPERISWSQKLMTWTPKDIVRFNPECDPEFIINSCGDFNNVPLLGTRGGIGYSPVLARRQFGYYMEMNPVYLILDNDFFLYKKDEVNQRTQFEKAWYSIVREDRDRLGKPGIPLSV